MESNEHEETTNNGSIQQRKLPRAEPTNDDDDDVEKGVPKHEKGEEDGCCLSLVKCLLCPCYCNVRHCSRCLARHRTVYCLIALASLVMAYGYIVLINDFILHSYQAREARGLPVPGAYGIHGPPHVIEKTQWFYAYLFFTFFSAYADRGYVRTEITIAFAFRKHLSSSWTIFSLLYDINHAQVTVLGVRMHLDPVNGFFQIKEKRIPPANTDSDPSGSH